MTAFYCPPFSYFHLPKSFSLHATRQPSRPPSLPPQELAPGKRPKRKSWLSRFLQPQASFGTTIVHPFQHAAVGDRGPCLAMYLCTGGMANGLMGGRCLRESHLPPYHISRESRCLVACADAKSSEATTTATTYSHPRFVRTFALISFGTVHLWEAFPRDNPCRYGF